MRLSELHTGDRAIIVRHHAQGAFRKRILEMGFLRGKEILVVKSAPMQDPVQYRILNYDVSLRRQEAETIEVELISPNEVRVPEAVPFEASEDRVRLAVDKPVKDPKRIKVAFVGNPNCGKTSLFNAASGANEHVGNYSGVTVEAKTAQYRQGGYTFDLVDLPVLIRCRLTVSKRGISLTSCLVRSSLMSSSMWWIPPTSSATYT